MQLDAFDYLEPRCPLTGGKEFYGGNPEQQCGSIPVEAVIEKLDGYLNREPVTLLLAGRSTCFERPAGRAEHFK